MSLPKKYNDRCILTVKVVGVMMEMVQGRPADSFEISISINKIHTVTMEGSNTYGTPREASESTKTSTVGAIFGRFYGYFKTMCRVFLIQRGAM